ENRVPTRLPDFSSGSGPPAPGRDRPRPPLGEAVRRDASEVIVERISAVAGALVALLFLLGAGYGVSRSASAYYFDPKYQRDDYRGLARLIAAAGAPGDGIILNAPGQAEIFGYYYKGDLPVYPLPRQRPLDLDATRGELNEILAHHSGVWLVLWA